MHEVENLTQVAPESVEGVHHDRVARPSVGEHLGQPGALDGRAGLVVGVGLLVRDAGRSQGVELAFEALLGSRHSGVTEVKSAPWMIASTRHPGTVPQAIAVAALWTVPCGTTC